MCNALASFKLLVEEVLRGLNRESCWEYLDEVIVLERSFDDHLKNLQAVFAKLKVANLNLNVKKCYLDALFPTTVFGRMCDSE